MAKRPTREEREAATLQEFVKQAGRKAQKNTEPNDRRYDHAVQRRVRRMKPDDLDALLRQGDEDTSS